MDSNQSNNRRTVVVIHDTKRKAIHFTDTKLQGEDVWFPYEKSAIALLPAIERLMTLNRVAHNVVSVEHQRRCGVCDDWRVVYNIDN